MKNTIDETNPRYQFFAMGYYNEYSEIAKNPDCLYIHVCLDCGASYSGLDNIPRYAIVFDSKDKTADFYKDESKLSISGFDFSDIKVEKNIIFKHLRSIIVDANIDEIVNCIQDYENCWDACSYSFYVRNGEKERHFSFYANNKEKYPQLKWVIDLVDSERGS